MTKYLKMRYSSIFQIQNPSLRIGPYQQWSKNVKRYMILCEGSYSNIYDLCLVVIRNCPHNSQQTHNILLKINTKAKFWHHSIITTYVEIIRNLYSLTSDIVVCACVFWSLECETCPNYELVRVVQPGYIVVCICEHSCINIILL